MQNQKNHFPLTMEKAGKAGGAYLESIGKYDVTKLSKEEWDKFIEIICNTFDFIPY